MKILRITILLCVVAGMSDIISAQHQLITCTDLTLLNGNNCYSYYEGQTCHFSCNTGYTLIGSSSRTCTSTGWTGTQPSCDAQQQVTCTDLTLPNGNNCYSYYEGQTCHFSCNAGYALIGSSSRTCTSTGWTGTHPFCDGEAWKQDITSESQTHSGKSHYDLAAYLRTFLKDKYPSVYWVAVVYDDVSGWEAHTVKGSYHHLFRHYGHNIVVGRVILPSNGNEPSDISGKFWAAYAPTYYENCWDPACWSRQTKLNSQPSVRDTWSNLYNQGLTPVMLHMFTSGIGYGIAHHFDGRLLVTGLTNGGQATLIAES